MTSPSVTRRLSTKEIAVAAVFAATYAIMVVALAPYSFLPFQVRFADAMLPLSMLFGMPAVIGLTLGCSVANFVGGVVYFGGWSALDIIGGSVANFMATYAAWKIGRGRSRFRRLTATLVETAVVTLIVGSYLWVIIGMPGLYALPGLEVQVPGLLGMWVGILIGSTISINLLGFLLLEAVSKSIRSQQVSSTYSVA